MIAVAAVLAQPCELLLHHTGKKTGHEYINPVIYLNDGDNHVLIIAHQNLAQLEANVDRANRSRSGH